MTIGRMTRAETRKSALLGVLLGALPHVLGLMFSFAAFVVTPIAFAVTCVVIGVLITRFMQSARWSAVVVCSLIAGATFVSLFYLTFGVLSVVNFAQFHTAPAVPSGPDAAGTTAVVVAYSVVGFFAVSAIAATLITGGVLLGRLRPMGGRST